MKIALMCGSLEPRRDGVGDYTAGFADELRQQGHEAIAIALRDPFVKEDEIAPEISRTPESQSLRLSSRLPWSKRIQIAEESLNRFGPDWLSLQFVSYAFHPKGVVHGLANKLASLRLGRKLHIMFHEIWLCKELGWGWRKSAMGALQRLFFQRLVRSIKPNAMHTSNATYAGLLNRSGISVQELGLFGSVPVLSAPRTEWIESQMRSAIKRDYHRDRFWLFGLFGALHSQWPPEPLLTLLRCGAQSVGKQPVLLSIGRPGSGGAELWQNLTCAYRDRFIFISLGEQPAERISEYLSYLDCGIATTPRSIIGKSSTTISMLEHGLPVIVNRDDDARVVPSSDHSESLLIRCDHELESRLRGGLHKGPRGSRRPQIARTFLQGLLPMTQPSFV